MHTYAGVRVFCLRKCRSQRAFVTRGIYTRGACTAAQLYRQNLPTGKQKKEGAGDVQTCYAYERIKAHTYAHGDGWAIKLAHRSRNVARGADTGPGGTRA